MDETTHGPVEAAWRKWVATLGELSERQQAEAETLYRIAEELDLKTDRPASAIGTLRRALTATVDRLRDEKAARPAGPTPAAPNVSSIGSARAARAERRKQGPA